MTVTINTGPKARHPEGSVIGRPIRLPYAMLCTEGERWCGRWWTASDRHELTEKLAARRKHEADCNGGLILPEAGLADRRTFTGLRPEPRPEYVEQGLTNSGREPDYEGCVFSDGTVVVRWLTEYRSHSVWASFDDFYQVHGHPEYGTRLVFDDGLVVNAEHPYNPLFGLPLPIVPVPVDEPDGERLSPRHWNYPIA